MNDVSPPLLPRVSPGFCRVYRSKATTRILTISALTKTPMGTRAGLEAGSGGGHERPGGASAEGVQDSPGRCAGESHRSSATMRPLLEHTYVISPRSHGASVRSIDRCGKGSVAANQARAWPGRCRRAVHDPADSGAGRGAFSPRCPRPQRLEAQRKAMRARARGAPGQKRRTFRAVDGKAGRGSDGQAGSTISFEPPTFRHEERPQPSYP